jgi:putative peptidoglycan lipid II flippase
MDTLHPTLGLLMARGLGMVSALVFATVTAKVLGADRQTDLALNALVIPNALLIVIGALVPPTLVSVFKSTQIRLGGEEAARFARSALIVLTALSIVFCSAGVLMSPVLARLLGPGFGAEEVSRTAGYMAAAFPVVLMTTISSVQKGLLNARGVFLWAALDTLWMNLASIVIVLWAGPSRGAAALIGAALLGGVARVLGLAAASPGTGARGWGGALVHPELRTFMSLLWPVLVQSGLAVAAASVINALASRLPGEGAITQLNYAQRIAIIPNELILFAIGTVVLPSMAASHASREPAEIRRVASQGLRMAGVLMVPAAVGLFVLSEPIIRALFERGRFGVDDARMTAGVLRFASIGVLAAGNGVVSQAFYAMQNTRSLLVIGVAVAALQIGGGLALAGPMRQDGLALASAASNVVGFLVTAVVLARRVGGLEGRALALSFLRFLTAGTVMGVAVWFAERHWLAHWPPIPGLTALLLGGAAIYLAALALLRADEWKAFLRRPAS